MSDELKPTPPLPKDIRHYVSDDAHVVSHIRWAWRLFVTGALIALIGEIVNDPVERPTAVVTLVVFTVLAVPCWKWRMEIVGRQATLYHWPLASDVVDLSRLTSVERDWVLFMTIDSRRLSLEDLSGGKLRLTWVLWSQYSLVRDIANEWQRRGGHLFDKG